MKIPRNAWLNRLLRTRNNGLIKVVTGVAGCGKSFLLHTLLRRALLEAGTAEDHIVEVALDDAHNQTLRDPDALLAFLKARIQDAADYFVFLDEVQYLNEFEDVLNSLLHIPNVDVYVTGSQARHLACDQRTEFRGRSVEMHLLPLTFREYAAAWQACGAGSRDEAWDNYVLYGGLPQILALAADKKVPDVRHDALQIRLQLHRQLFLANAVGPRAISRQKALAALGKRLATCAGSGISMPRLVRELPCAHEFFGTPADVHEDLAREDRQEAMSAQTAKRHLELLADAFWVHRVGCLDIRQDRLLQTAPRYFFEDTGLLRAFANFQPLDRTMLVRHILCNELRARGCQVNAGILSVHAKGPDGRRHKQAQEVTFVADKGPERTYVQYCPGQDLQREASMKHTLARIPDSFRKIVLVDGMQQVRWDRQGIATMGLTNFLLDENSLKV